NVLKTAKEDSNKVNELNDLSREATIAGKFVLADSIALQALLVAEKIKYKNGEAAAYRNVGKIADEQGDYTEALKNLQLSLELYKETGNKRGVCRAYLNIANIYESEGNYPQAIASNLDVLKISEDMGYKSGQGQALLDIGSIYSYLNNFNDALKYYMKSLKIFQEIGDTEEMGDNYDCIGGLYCREHKFTEALDYMTRFLKIEEAAGDKQGLSYAYANIGVVYDEEGNYETGLNYFLQAAKISEDIGDKHGIAGAYVNIGDNLTKQKKYTQAKEWLVKALQQARIVGSKDILKIVFSNLTCVDSLMGDYKNSIHDYETYIVFRDSLKNAENTRKIVSEQMTYEFNKKQDSIKIAEDKKEADIKADTDKKEQRQRILRDVLLAGFFLTLLFAFVFFFQRRRISKEKKRSDELLLNILPEETADELKMTGTTKARNYGMVTVMFTDFISFTKTVENMDAQELVNSIHHYYSEFDKIVEKYGIEKIKTIGDGYMAAGGLPIENHTNPVDIINAALEIIKFIEAQRAIRLKEGMANFQIRIGVHTGPVVAGIVGIKKFAYDIWGDTVNIAHRVESVSEPGKINISGSTYDLVKDKFICTYRGKIQAKNKGEIDMYFVEKPL
ncbi:MAG TPA: adenylate/guanylate cyclase domain-containing protein, partial [Bacteroidia bacterium]|nr:adenylate/guanylate cyclase domain-containing protein [Bacteroidia bacterium]